MSTSPGAAEQGEIKMSASRQDVEKIVTEAIFDIFGKCDGSVTSCKRIILAAIAQAREPLIADKERLDWLDEHACDIDCVNLRKGVSLREAIDAVLTGTEEK